MSLAPRPPRNQEERIDRLLDWAEECKAFLREQREIRVFVEDAWNRGHQASSVLLLRHLVRVARLGSANQLTIVYRNENARRLLSGFLSSPGEGDGGPLAGLSVRLRSLEEIRQEPWIEFGFSGASDVRHDLSRLVRCRCFLWMQPFRWGNLERILCRQSSRSPVTRDTVVAHPWTRGLGLHEAGFSLPPPAEPDWPRVGASRATSVIRAALAADPRKVALLPAYSMGAGSVIGVSHLALRNLLLGVQNALDRGLESAVLILDLSPDTCQEAIDRLKPLLDRHRPGWSGRTCTDVDEDSSRVEERIVELQKGQILLLHTPEIKPQALFDYVLSQARLPCVFEGLGTAARAVTLGKPFLQVSQRSYRAWQVGRRPRAWERSYPSLPGFSSLPFRCQSAANTLARLQPRPDLFGSFLLDCTRGDSRLLGYFRLLAERHLDPRRDRLLLNLGLLELLRRFPELRGQGQDPGWRYDEISGAVLSRDQAVARL